MELALSFQVLVFLAVLGVFLASGQATLLHPGLLYLLFHFLAFVARPLLVYFFQFDSIWNYIGMQPTQADLVLTLEVSSAALVAFMATCMAAGRVRISYGSAGDPSFSPVQKRALLATTLLFAPLIAYSIYATRNGVQGARAANGVFVMTSTTGYINDVQFVIGSFLVAWVVATRFHRSNLFPILIYVGYRAWFGWSRFTIVLFVMSFMVAYAWHRRSRWPAVWILVACLPMLVLFNILGHNRDYVKTRLQGQTAQIFDPRPGLSTYDKIRMQADTQDFANFDYLTFILSIVPKRTGEYTHGVQYLQLFTEPIPRFLWKGKPTGTPVRTFNIGAYGNFTGLTWSLPGDGWCSGGWVGLVITLSMVGTLLGLFHRYFWKHVSNPMAAVFYIASLPTFIQWFRDGGIGIAKFLFWAWLPFFVWVGMTWLLGFRHIPGSSVVFRKGESLRLVHEPARRSSDSPDLQV